MQAIIANLANLANLAVAIFMVALLIDGFVTRKKLNEIEKYIKNKK